MNGQDSRALDILKELGERPAAPFHESAPAAYILETLEGVGLESKVDQFGNVIARYRNSEGDDPPLALVAHMDHPGFEIVEASERGLVAVALGGVPEVSLTNPADVLVLLEDGVRLPARIVPFADGDGRTVRVELSEDRPIEPPVPVVFNLPGLLAGRRIYQDARAG